MSAEHSEVPRVTQNNFEQFARSHTAAETKLSLMRDVYGKRINEPKRNLAEPLAEKITSATAILAPMAELPGAIPLGSREIQLGKEQVVLGRVFLPETTTEYHYEVGSTPDAYIPGTQAFIGFSEVRRKLENNDPESETVSFSKTPKLDEGDVDTILAAYEKVYASEDASAYGKALVSELRKEIDGMKSQQNDEADTAVTVLEKALAETTKEEAQKLRAQSSAILRRLKESGTSLPDEIVIREFADGSFYFDPQGNKITFNSKDDTKARNPVTDDQYIKFVGDAMKKIQEHIPTFPGDDATPSRS
ncbi:MAG: hypothetical protein H0W89_04580 [Candidatus Levybacteria bacterium]|nr:hypothetical protein [Candidatus Levybacteria bacterium]